jgi:SAM-dependent methyltransferase
MRRKDHWDTVYRTKAHDTVSWHQARPEMSVQLIDLTRAGRDEGIIDVGGGASMLVDHLLDAGYSRVAVLDISGAALQQTQQRLRERAAQVEWIVADITTFNPQRRFVVWHDRAVFHFLTSPVDRRAYVDTIRRTLAPDGHVIIGTFALDGPPTCSGLDVVRYDAPSLASELGPDFVLSDTRRETHRTPAQAGQEFLWCSFTYLPGEKSNFP